MEQEKEANRSVRAEQASGVYTLIAKISPDDLIWERLDRIEAALPKPRGPLVSVVPVEGKGRGVIALEVIEAGTVIEVAPVKPFNNWQALPRELEDLPIAWADDQDIIAMGAVQFVNHSEAPNCRLDRDFDHLTISLVATIDIAAGEELTIHYAIPTWFEVKP